MPPSGPLTADRSTATVMATKTTPPRARSAYQETALVPLGAGGKFTHAATPQTSCTVLATPPTAIVTLASCLLSTSADNAVDAAARQTQVVIDIDARNASEADELQETGKRPGTKRHSSRNTVVMRKP